MCPNNITLALKNISVYQGKIAELELLYFLLFPPVHLLFLSPPLA
jgi:hypothetical protein